MFLIFWLSCIVFCFLIFRYWISKDKFSDAWYLRIVDQGRLVEYLPDYYDPEKTNWRKDDITRHLEGGKDLTRFICLIITLIPFANLVGLLVIALFKDRKGLGKFLRLVMG